MKKRMFSIILVILAITLATVSAEVSPQITAVWSDKDVYKVGEEVTIYANIKYEDGTPFVVEEGKTMVTFGLLGLEEKETPHTRMTYDTKSMYYIGRAPAPNFKEVRAWVNIYEGVDLSYMTIPDMHNTYTFKVIDAIEIVVAPKVYIADVWSDKESYKIGEEVIIYAKVIGNDGEPAAPEKGYSVSGNIRNFGKDPVRGLFFVYNQQTGYWEAKERIPQEISSPVNVFVEARLIINGEQVASAENTDFYFKVEGVEQEEVIEPVERPEVVTNPCAKLWTECRVRVMKELGYAEGEVRTGEEEVKFRIKISEECSLIYQKCIEERCVPIETYKGCIRKLSAVEFLEKYEYENKCGIPCPLIEERQVKEISEEGVYITPKRVQEATGFLTCVGKVLKTELTEEEVEKLSKEAEMICREPMESLGASVSCVVRILKGYPEIKKRVLMECAPYVAEEEAIISETMSAAVPEGYGMRDIFCQGCRQDSKCLPYGTKLKIPESWEGGGCKEECFECKGGCEIDLKTGLEVCYEPPKECLEKGIKSGEKICKMVCSEPPLKEETPVYCSIEGTFKPQVAEGEECQNNFECLSNQCSNGKCIDLEKQLKETQSTLNKIMDWLRSFFGVKKPVIQGYD